MASAVAAAASQASDAMAVEGFDIFYTGAWFAGEIVLFFLATPLADWLPSKNAREHRVVTQRLAPQMVMSVLVVKGIVLFNYSELFKGNREERLHMPVKGVSALVMIEIAHCAADTVLNFIVDSDYDNSEMIWHHIISAVMLCCCFAPFGHAYMPFACGVVHIPDVFFMMQDILKRIPIVQDKLPRINTLMKVLCGISFIGTRIILWMPIFAIFILDNLADLLNDTTHNGIVSILQMVGICILTYLQWRWSWIMIKHAIWGKPKEN
jgi:hypothetical protein